MDKRKFYNVDEAKGFTREVFFQKVMEAIMSGDVTQADADLIVKACEYELETIEINKAKNKAKAKTGEQKDPLASEYAVALKGALMQVLTGEAQTVVQLSEKMNNAGLIGPTGKQFAIPWIGRVLNLLPGVAADDVVVEKTKTVNGTTLKVQEVAKGYKLV